MHLPLGLPDETHQQEGFLDWPPGSQCGGRVHMDGWKPCGLQVRGPVGSGMGTSRRSSGLRAPQATSEGERALGSGLLSFLSHRERMKGPRK